MADEAPEVNELAEVPASEQEATTAPVTEGNSPEENTSDATQEKPPRLFTQEEVDDFLGKRIKTIQKRLEREQARKAQQAPALPAEPPVPEQFDSTEAYAQALATRKAEELLVQREEQRQQAELIEAYHDLEEEAREKYDDFEQVAYNPRLPITNTMAQAIQASEIGPEVAYYLGSNPKEAERISRLSAILQAKEIGKVEAKLASDPPAKKTSNAPAPISPVTTRSTGGPAYDTTDPRSIKTMSTSDWIAAERQRQVKKLEARNLR
jgi:hypothetical protein